MPGHCHLRHSRVTADDAGGYKCVNWDFSLIVKVSAFPFCVIEHNHDFVQHAIDWSASAC